MRREGKVRIVVSIVIMSAFAWLATANLYTFFRMNLENVVVDTKAVSDLAADGTDVAPAIKLFGLGFNVFFIVVSTLAVAAALFLAALILLVPFLLIGLSKKRRVDKAEYRIVKWAYVIILTLAFLTGGILTRFSLLVPMLLLDAAWMLPMFLCCILPMKMRSAKN